LLIIEEDIEEKGGGSLLINYFGSNIINGTFGEDTLEIICH
jgi:hypothetical protein